MFNLKLFNDKNAISRNYWIIIVAVLIILGIFFIPKLSGNVTKTEQSSNDITKITLGLKDYNYYPNVIHVKKGVPVEITLDNSIQGCLRTFTIKELGVYKSSANPDDKITFTPNKAGKFEFACSMHMGYGTIIVD